MRLFSIIMILFVLITSCKNDNIEPQTDTKIKQLIVLFSNDSAKYNFTYNSDNTLQKVMKNGTLYAEIIYENQIAYLIKNFPSLDTFKFYLSTAKYIDSIYNNNYNIHFFRTTTNHLDSIKYQDGNFSLYHKNILYNGNNISYFSQLLPYTCNVFNFCTVNSDDTIIYNTQTIQTNLPEQFVGIPLSQIISFIDLDPIFMMQQSGISSHLPSTNLRSEWNTKYSILISQSPPSSYNFQYEYIKDSLKRVTEIKVFQIKNDNRNIFRTYKMTY